MYETTVACLQWLRETIHDLSSHVNQWYEKNLKSCLKILKIGCINPLRVPRTYIYVNPVHASSSRATTVHAFRVHQGRIYSSHVNQWYEKNLKNCLKILKIGCINPLRVPRTYIYVNPVHASSSRATTVHAFRVHQGRIYTSLAVGKKIARHAKGK